MDDFFFRALLVGFVSFHFGIISEHIYKKFIKKKKTPQAQQEEVDSDDT